LKNNFVGVEYLIKIMDVDSKKYKRIFNSNKTFQQKLDLAEKYAMEVVKYKIQMSTLMRYYVSCKIMPINLN